MRADRVLGAVLAGALFAGCSNSSTAPLPSPQPVSRGKLERMFSSATITKAQMNAGLFGKIISLIGGPALCNVHLYGMVYGTIGVHGEAANASAAFFVPEKGCKGPFPLVGYSHGTNPVKEQLITDPRTTSATWTAPDQDPIVVAAIYAAHGYAVAATDYLGLGLSTYPFHPYLHADSEASAVVDSMVAARTAALQLHVPLSNKAFLSGHSQGGQSAVATQRAIETGAAGGASFDLRGVEGSSGPYALARTFRDSLRHQSQDAPILAAYVIPGYQKVYGNVYSDPSQVFQSPFAQGIDSLLPVQTYADEAKLYGKTLPLSLYRLLQRSFVTSFLTDSSNGAYKDAAANDLLGAWTPHAPVFLCGGDRDPEVEFKNAQSAYALWKARGVNVSLTDVNQLIPSYVPLKDYHVVVALFCLPIGRVQFFDTLK